MANEVQNRFKDSSMMIATEEALRKLQDFAKDIKVEYSEYGKLCVDNMFSKVNDLLQAENQTWNYFNTPHGINNLFSTMKYVAYMELNPANSEVALKWRNKKINGEYVKVLEATIQGIGNDRIIKRFGESVIEVRSYIVREGDDFTPPYIDGFNYVLPKWQPKYKSEKAIYAVYLMKLASGDIDVSIATREDVKVSLLAHINENMRNVRGFTSELQTKIESLTLDQILYSEYAKMKIDNVRLISPAWGDFAKEKMIDRKIRNHALRKWAHNLNFGRKEVADIYQDGWEEENYNQPKDKGIVIEHNQQEFVEKSGSVEVGAIEDKGKDVGETVVVKQETQEPVLVEVPIIETPKELIEDDDLSWTKD